MWEDFENALAWYAAAPGRWAQSARQDLGAAAEWVWVVLQGDFAEDQSTAQAITGTVISMIPIVDQLCDVRDVVANCRKIKEDTSNKWAWFALALTLIGLFPTLGSLVKGCFKVLFAYGRKAMFASGKAALDTDLWKTTQPFVEAGIKKLNEFLARPEVRKTLSALKIDNVYKYLADKLREISAGLNVAKLTQSFDAAIKALTSLLDMVKKWGNRAMATRAGQMLQDVKRIRDMANEKLADVLAPLQGWLNRLAQRLDVEHRLGYKATTNTVNPHSFVRPSNADELAAFERDLPGWVDKTKKMTHEPSQKAPVAAGWPDIGDEAPKPLMEAHKTFENGGILAVTYPPGTVLYRVLDPRSNDNSICWMSKAEFDKLRSKNDWRRRFAVWGSWNSNGEFVTYTVPPGKGLNAWEGVTASQKIEGTLYKLEGGAVQIVLDPADLNRAYLGERQFTGWSYDDLGRKVDLVGVPILQTNWYEPRK